MKKNFIKIFMIIIIANILILNTESFATQKTDNLISKISIQVSDNTVDYGEILNTVLGADEYAIRDYKDERLNSYLTNLKEAQKNGKVDYNRAQQAINKLENEKNRRATSISTSTNAEVINYIIKINDAQLKQLTTLEINQYINKLKSMSSTETNLNAALARLNSEKIRREQAGSTNSGTDSGFDYKDYTPGGKGNSTKIETMAGKVLGIVRNIGVAVSIIALTIIGIKYMFGSVEQKADYKKSMIPFVIGIIMLAAGTTLVTFIFEAVTGAQQSTEGSSTSGGGPQEGITIYETMLN